MRLNKEFLFVAVALLVAPGFRGAVTAQGSNAVTPAGIRVMNGNENKQKSQDQDSLPPLHRHEHNRQE